MNTPFLCSFDKYSKITGFRQSKNSGGSMRDYSSETEKRVAWIRDMLAETGTKGIIFGNSGGKDSALVGILCRMAAENVLGVIMPCQSSANYGTDHEHAELLARQFDIESMVVDLTPCKEALLPELGEITPAASGNINPRLRMTTLYALGQSRGYLVVGTSNKSERYTGYFTKWGDGACDFNPISDLLATEVFEFLRYLGAPDEIVAKPPSAGLFEGQTDEADMGVSYSTIDAFIQRGEATAEDAAKISRMHTQTAHKRTQPKEYVSNKQFGLQSKM